MSYEENYKQYRGKCRELAEEACANNPELKLVRGHYWCPIWNREEPHWWCTDGSGKIVDPSARQFPSAGLGIYTPFNELVACAECGKSVQEHEATFESNYAFCSTRCLMRFVGL
ncbi:hypothetical protein ACJU26_09625 [Acidithiobacillus sp. M4-SHS-6]|uniref:hypothetical protein n=1 Tax=Acidithiobacillus sp. M4-SHS-6 TaxID=3383024 RepID=UPI0039BE8035